MKDYIDKLREDYHRKRIQKLALGDKFFDPRVLEDEKDLALQREEKISLKAKTPLEASTLAQGKLDMSISSPSAMPTINDPYKNVTSSLANYPEEKISLQAKSPIINQGKVGTITSPAGSNPTLNSVTSTPLTGSNPTLNSVTSSPFSQNSYGIQTGINKKTGNTITSEVDPGLGPDISATVGKNSSIDFTPQQKFQNAITLNQGPTSNEELATKTVEAETKKLGPVFEVGEGNTQNLVEPNLKEEPKVSTTNQQPTGFFIPPNGDLTTNLYNLGRAIGSKPGTDGRGLAIGSNAVAAGLEGARALFSGVGFSKAQGYTDQYNQEQMLAARKKYESNPQYKNTNYTGGVTESRFGGRLNFFEDGGEQMDPRQAQMMQMMQQQQGQQQMDPRQDQMMQGQQGQQMDPRQAQMMQQQQETQMTSQESAAFQKIAEKLVNSFETIEQIAEYLQENKVDEATYQAILTFAQDMIEDRDETKEENEESTDDAQEEEGPEEMRKGGKKFNKKVGEYIEFEYGGKTYKGTIKSIKNGQIYLK